MPRTILNDVKIRALKADRQTDFWDTKTPGFGVRISPRSKTFIANRNGTRQTLGHYPAITLQEARRRFFAFKAVTDTGHPQISFQQARSEFLVQDRWKPRSAREITRLLTRYFDWQKTLNKITAADISAAIDAIPAKSEAAHALKDIKTFFNWCVPRYLPHSPCVGVKPPTRYVPRERLLTIDELSAIWRAAEEMGGYGRQVQLLIATGQRCNQIISIRPEWIDHKNRLIQFPASVMKGNRSHTIPLGTLTASLLGGDRPTTYQGKKKTELDRLSGVTLWTLHDIRRAFASGMASLGIALPVIERLLAHRSGSFAGIVGVYQHYDFLPEARRAIDLWENHILQTTNY
jgi:integrase